MNSVEATRMAEGKENSLLHITRAEIDCPEGTDVHSEEVYNKSIENFKKFQNKGWLKQDESDKYYIYAQTMDGRTQYGIVGAAACKDYHDGVIKKHELTRPDKEEDRMILTRYLNANIEPVFFSYKAVPEIDKIVASIVKNKEPDYSFVAEDGFGHQFWTINENGVNQQIEELFATKVAATYVADGHHRTAAAARIGLEKKAQNPNHTGDESYNYLWLFIFLMTNWRLLTITGLLKT